MNRTAPDLHAAGEGQIQGLQTHGQHFPVCQAHGRGVGRLEKGLGMGMVTVSLGEAKGPCGRGFPSLCPTSAAAALETSCLRTHPSPPSTKPLKEINLSAD